MQKRTGCAAVGVTLWYAPAAVPFSLPHTSWEHPQLFAVCAGRLSAIAVHEHRRDPDAFSRTIAQVGMLNDLVDATLPMAEAHGLDRTEVNTWRFEARTEISVTLEQAYHSFDTRIAELAQRDLVTKVRFCRDLLPSTN